MSGPEHYRRAEDLLREATSGSYVADQRIREAEVHATLALAAAQIARIQAIRVRDADAWTEVTS